MNKPLLTVAIFTYNFEKYIKECLESVVSQKTNYPYEIHICDDCSTDNTISICKDYAEKYPEKIKLFLQEKNPFRLPYHQYHVYLKLNSLDTKYWCFLNGDDCWCDENKIELAIDYMEKHPECNMVAHNVLINDTKRKQKYFGISEGIAQNVLNKDVVIEEYLGFMYPSARILRNTFTPIYVGDSIMYLSARVHGTLHYIHKVMSIYNVHGNGTWSSLSAQEQDTSVRMIPYRMCQLDSFQREHLWFQLLNPTDKIIVRTFKASLSMKSAWRRWFHTSFVPIYGNDVMHVNWSPYRPFK